MSRLAKLQGKSKEYELEGEKYTIKPFTLDDMSLFDIDPKAPIQQQMKSIKQMVNTVLKESVPDCTDEEIQNMQLGHTFKFVEFIMDVNGLKGDKAKGTNAIKERIDAINRAKAAKAETKPEAKTVQA